MITRVLRSGRPGVLFKFALLPAGALVFGLGCATGGQKAQKQAEVVTYSFTFTAAAPPGGLCTITPEDVVSSTDCAGDKKCGRASKRNGDSINFVSTPGSTYETSPKKIDFTVVFDPFKHGSIPGNPAKPYKLDTTLPGDSTGSKSYSFSVVAKGCTPLDPRVVIDP